MEPLAASSLPTLVSAPGSATVAGVGALQAELAKEAQRSHRPPQTSAPARNVDGIDRDRFGTGRSRWSDMSAARSMESGFAVIALIPFSRASRIFKDHAMGRLVRPYDTQVVTEAVARAHRPNYGPPTSGYCACRIPLKEFQPGGARESEPRGHGCCESRSRLGARPWAR